MKAQQLQAQFIRKREQEQQRIQQTESKFVVVISAFGGSKF